MKIENYQFPKSAFLSVEKDLEIITDLFLKNNNLKKLLYYNTRTALKEKNLTEDESLELFGKNIRIVPKVPVDNEMLNYIVIRFDNFTETYNQEFRDNLVAFDIVCNYDMWQLQDFQLRPYRIMAEIDSMLNHQRLTGLGELEFIGATFVPMNSNQGGFCLLYKAVHGEEDKKFMPNPINEEAMINNFDEIFNR